MRPLTRVVALALVVVTLASPVWADSFSGSASGPNAPNWISVKSFGAICDGTSHPLSGQFASLAAAQAVYPFITSLSQETDYAALKAASNAAFGADGSEHGNVNPQLNSPVYIPRGICTLGSDTWTIRKLDGGRILGDGAQATQIQGSGTAVLAFDGLWYSTLEKFKITQLSSSSTTALDIDGNTGTAGYTTFTVQGNSFYNMFVDGGGATYAIAVCRQGGSSGQCSENTWENLHATRGSSAVYYQYGFNALSNVLIGGDIQDYPVDGIFLHFGSIKVYGTSFESTTAFTQIANGGCDVTDTLGGAGDSIQLYGNRTESLCFANIGGGVYADIHGLSQSVSGYLSWAGTTHFNLNDMVQGTDSNGVSHIFYVTTAGTSGSTQPTWPTGQSATVSDGSIVWTEYTNPTVEAANGTYDSAAGAIDPNSYAGVQIGTLKVGGGYIARAITDNNGDNAIESCIGQWTPTSNNLCLYYNPQSFFETLKSTVSFPAGAGLMQPNSADLALGNINTPTTAAIDLVNPTRVAVELQASMRACNSVWKGYEIFVSDATDPGRGNAIVAGGGNGVKAICAQTATSTYNWVAE